MKQQLRTLYAEVLTCVDPARAMHGPNVCDLLRNDPTRPLLVLAFGKAARTMAAALLEQLPDTPVRGLVVPPEQDTAALPPLEIIAGGHPLPTIGSLKAAHRALELARSVGTDERIYFLVSGGGSAMLEASADANVGIDELRKLNQALVGSGAGIEPINTVRRHLSAIKGGRLALAGAAAHWQRTVMVSDVPFAVAATIASGPTVSDPTSLEDCREVLDRYALWPAVPMALRTRIEQANLPSPMPPGHELEARSDMLVLLSDRDARSAASKAAEGNGWIVDNQCDVDDWPYEQAAEHLLQRLEQLHQANPGKRVAVVTTGELSVALPSSPGSGGRNVQFALHCATRIQGQAITILSCGTDGIDGNCPAAGAIVDGKTVARARDLGLDVDHHLARCDAFPLLDALGDCLKPGPTGTNVRDIRVLVRDA
ncbi:MAG: glycerate 2-kinase [Planctomycetota bacterium]|jgi:glycerate 2-kinase